MKHDYVLPDNYKIGLIQIKFKAGEVDTNLMEADWLIGCAVKEGAKLVLLPELWAIGYGLDHPQSFSEPIGGPITGFMCEQAKKHQIFVAGGYPEKDAEGKCYDSALLINPQGEVILNQRKVHLYTALGEDKVWFPGDSFRVVKTELGRIGILICYDGDFPESWRALASQGVDMILHPTAYESPCEDFGWWKKIYEANALINAVWCASANLVGDTPKKESHFFGWSRIINPLGEEVSSASYIGPGEEGKSEVHVVDLPFADAIKKGNVRNGCFLKDRKPHAYNTSPQE